MNQLTLKHRLALTLGAAAVALNLVTPAAAAVSYSEGSEGDLSSSESFTKFIFGEGVNSISGSTRSSDRDAFDFEVLLGQQITGVSIAADTANTALWYIESIGGNFGYTGGHEKLFDIDELPLGEGTYELRSLTVAGSDGGQTAYTFMFQVATVEGIAFQAVPAAFVPEPTSIALVGAALAGLGWARRRRS